MLKTIDVSKHDGVIDWAKVKKDGVKAVIIRAGYGKSTTDFRFKQNIEGVIKQGLHVGIYWFSYAYTVSMAENEATVCNNTIKSYKDGIDLPVYFDWEYDSMDYFKKKTGKSASTKLITDMTIGFCEKIQSLGYAPGIYFNKDYKNNHLDMDRLGSYSHWLAYYTSAQQTGVDIWQYSESGKVSGISTKCDMNELLNESIIKATKKEVDHAAERKRYIKGMQKALNTDYNCKLKVDGKYGVLTHKALGNHNINKNSKQASITHLKYWLNYLGFRDKDGNKLNKTTGWDAGTDYALKSAQKKCGLKQDACFGNGTCEAVMKLI